MLSDEIKKRRTFAIIAHPDAGKTTLTEKLLLFGGAIQLAGEVKAKKDRIQTRSDWMKIERERGISVMTSVMTFEYGGCVFNLLDTPGHEDFADDTYRTLSAVDSAVMVLDAARGIEPRTLKLFEVCRLRDIPIITFINKMDREARDPLELIDEIEEKLALDAAPITWPIGSGKNFAGTYNLYTQSYRRKDEQVGGTSAAIAEAAKLLPENERAAFMDGAEMAGAICKKFDQQAFLEGHRTPVYFGSALRNYGVRDLIEALAEYAPPPADTKAGSRTVKANENKMTGFVFKIQANMDPNHRDRMAFMRISSGTLSRGMKAHLTRTGKPITLSSPQFFFARSRQTADEACAGDVVGIANHGTLRIGDTLTEGEELTFRGVPNFAPEILRRVHVSDAMKAKKLKEALHQLAEEGVVQLFTPDDGAPLIIGVIGALQIDVLAERLKQEYNMEALFEQPRFNLCRWIEADNRADLDEFIAAHRSDMAQDMDGAPVFMAENGFSLNYEAQRWPKIRFAAMRAYQAGMEHKGH